MYIDVALINDFQKRYPNVALSYLEDILEYCGVWYSAEGIRAESEDFDMTLEEICSVYYFIVDKNKIKFANPDALWEDIVEYYTIDK